MPKPKPTWMKKYDASDYEEEARNWCIMRGIKVCPGGTQTRGQYTVDISLPGKSWRKSPQTYKDVESQEVMYNYYIYYYEKRK